MGLQHISSLTNTKLSCFNTRNTMKADPHSFITRAIPLLVTLLLFRGTFSGDEEFFPELKTLNPEQVLVAKCPTTTYDYKGKWILMKAFDDGQSVSVPKGEIMFD